jgi:ABC-type transport system involved in cytochrome c biogenesis permease subunit
MSFAGLPPETGWIWAGVAAYGGAAVAAIASATRTRAAGAVALERVVPSLIGAALLLIATGIAWRWQRVGHGPFLSMFEVLASSLFSLGFVYAIAYWRLPSIRRTAAIVLPVLLVMGAWLVTTQPSDTHLPPTYQTHVLWFHVLLGKVFLGCVVVALGLAGVILLRAHRRLAAGFARMPHDSKLDGLAWRFMQAALVFESAMLIAGAVWAQDAWGRYWAWDPLETWALLTWLALVAALHARVSWRLSPRAGAVLIVVVFVLAFVTFFGVPFVSAVPHQGAV